MPRAFAPSPTLAAAVRAHFRLTQAELAYFLGVSRPMIAAVEAGRKEFSDEPRRRLARLVQLLPAPDGQGPPVPVFGAELLAEAVPDTLGPLQARLRRCRFRAVQLRFMFGQAARPTQVQAQRRWAVGVLAAALSPEAVAPPTRWPGERPDPTRDATWVARLTAATAATPPPLTAAAHRLLLARLVGLDAEIVALEAALAELAE